MRIINLIRDSSRLVRILFIAVIVVSAGSGCKSKKKAMEAARIEAERTRLEQEAALRKQKEEEERARIEADEKARREAEARAKESEPYTKLQSYFQAIAGAGNVASANSSIQEALTLFASDDTPVLIVISEEGGQKDYDRPTTIKQYLEYLKDQKKSINKIQNLQFDNFGKIREVELVKQ